MRVCSRVDYQKRNASYRVLGIIDIDISICTLLFCKEEYSQTSNMYKTHPLRKTECFSSRLAFVFAQSIEAWC